MVDPVLAAEAATTLLANEKTRKGIGWAIVVVLSPIIVVLTLLCSLGSGAVSHNISAAPLCFQDSPSQFWEYITKGGKDHENH